LWAAASDRHRRRSCGKPVVVPHAPHAGEIVYARIRFARSLRLRLESLVFKPRRVPTIVLGGTFRFVPGTASGPLVLRMPASGGLSPLFGGFTAYEWFQLDHVASPFAVDFFALPIHGRPAASNAAAPPPGRLARHEVVVGARATGSRAARSPVGSTKPIRQVGRSSSPGGRSRPGCGDRRRSSRPSSTAGSPR